MIKNIYLLTLIFQSIIACGQKEIVKNQPKAIAFATIKNDTVVFNLDTISYKKTLKERLLPSHNIVFDKVEIKKQLTLGTSVDFYYVLLKTKDNKIKVARWLNKIGDSFYVNDEIEEGILFEQSYLICNGEGDCDPQVLLDGSTRFWGCSKIIACFTDKAMRDSTCKWQTTYIGP